MNINEYLDVFSKHKLKNSRVVGWSKSTYITQNPGHNVIFNANIFTLEDGKIWHGDIDLTTEKEKFEEVAKELGRDLYVLRELDGRFENEKLEQEQIAKIAVAKISCGVIL